MADAGKHSGHDEGGSLDDILSGLIPGDLDEELRRAFDAGWDARYGPPPFHHGKFVEGLAYSLLPPPLNELLTKGLHL